MSEEQVNAFTEAIRTDPALQEKIKGAADADAAVAIAQEAGFAISRDEIYWLLTEEALEGVVGGVGYKFDSTELKGRYS